MIDKIVGTVMLLASLLIFSYYTTWVVVTVSFAKKRLLA